MIKALGSGYRVKSMTGKNLGGPYKTKTQAQKRLAQVEMFKAMTAAGTKRKGK